MLAQLMAGGGAAAAGPKKEEAPAANNEEDREDYEAALDAPVQEDVVLQVDERDGRSRQGSSSSGHHDSVSQQDTLADEESQRPDAAKAVNTKA